jgi:PAS domain S-box-containing protein
MTDNERGTVLIVDDEAPSLRLLFEKFRNAGYRPLLAEDGAGAMRAIRRRIPDMALLDIRLPDMDGFELYGLLKAEKAAFPVMFLSALTDTEEKVRALEMNAVDYTTKPFDSEEVVARVEKHLELHRLRLLLAEREAAAQTARAEAEEAREAARRERDRFRALTEAAFEGVLMHENGKIVDANPAMEKIAGASREALIGRDVLTVFAPETHSEAMAWMKAPAAEPLELRGVRRDGKTTALEIGGRRITYRGREVGILAVRDITRFRSLEVENQAMRRRLDRADRFGEMVGKSRLMKTVYERIAQAAESTEPVVIYGETGTGKELAARMIFKMGKTFQADLVSVNCASVLENLFESLFFGHRKGAFTGALADAPGFFDQARGGTLFLDEVGELSPAMQAKLLRVLQDGEYRPLGAAENERANVRGIAATNRELRKMVRERTLREDFFHRIHVLALEIPPLRRRKEDIPLLVDHFLSARVETGRKMPVISAELMARFMAYHWPGNVRELFNELRRFAATGQVELGGGRPAEEADFAGESPILRGGRRLADAVSDFEGYYIQQTLRETGGRKKEAAERLGIDRRTLYNKLKQLPKS